MTRLARSQPRQQQPPSQQQQSLPPSAAASSGAVQPQQQQQQQQQQHDAETARPASGELEVQVCFSNVVAPFLVGQDITHFMEIRPL